MSPYRKGIEAYKSGSPQVENPYPKQSLAWHDWDRGWWDQFQWETAGYD